LVADPVMQKLVRLALLADEIVKARAER